MAGERHGMCELALNLLESSRPAQRLLIDEVFIRFDITTVNA
jgi:hypothetical protein